MLRPAGPPRASAPSRRRAQSANVPGASTSWAGTRYGPPTMGRVVRRVALFLVVAAVVPATAGAVVEQPFVPALQHERPGRDLGHRQHAGDVPRSRGGLRRLPGRHGQRRRAEQQQLRDGPRRRRRGSRHVQLVELDVHATRRQPGLVRRALLGRADDRGRGDPAPNPPRAGARCCRRPRAAATRHRDRRRSSTAVAGRTSPFADVTGLVRAGGPGRYRVANVQSGTGADRYAGWALVVVYRDLALPLPQPHRVRRARDDPAEPAAAPDQRERLPDAAVSGPVRTSVGLVAYEGDRGSSGDRSGSTAAI